jgi:LysM repeat protein/ABC-type branched-subunit amino acid transport system substrate-binding protein
MTTSQINLKKNSLNITTLLFTALLLCISVSGLHSQEDIHKTRSSAIINGVKYYLHTVEKGQTLFAIAKFYGKDVNDVVIENPEAIDGIKPGQVLRIPVEKKKPAEVTVSDTSNFIMHKVEKGQTLYSITKQYGVSDEKLKAINPELKEGLKIGQWLKIPSFKAKTIDPAISGKVAATVINTAGKDTSAMDHSQVNPVVYKGEIKDEYNIAFLLPFQAEEANAIENEKIVRGDASFSSKTTVALGFYEGVQLAIDSLKKKKLNAKVFVYDVDDKDSAAIYRLSQKPELKEMDLIFGPLYGSGFMPVAKFAKEQEIPIVSPFTQVNKILFNNPYVCKLSPSGTLQVEQMAKFVVDTFMNQNIILVNNLNPKEAAFFNAFRNRANEELIKAGKTTADSVKVAAGLGMVGSLMSSTLTNVVVLPSNNQSYVSDFISKLDQMAAKNKIVLFGMQNWMSYDNLDFEYLNHLSLHLPSNTFVDYSNPATRDFIAKYRQKYNTEPETFAFQGYDATMYFLSSLQKYGSGFLRSLPENKFAGLESNYLFSQFPADSGFENKFVYILKYQDYKLVKAN